MSEDLYQQAIITLAKRARKQPRLDAPDRTVTVDNPLCGDRITLDLVVNDDTVDEIGHKTRGCLLCEASACLITDHAPGVKITGLQAKAQAIIGSFSDDNQPLSDLWPGLDTLAPARGYKSRHECITLPFQALVKILGDQS
ncbi:MAG: iron-sulfur cluster assembly scaffold protein [Geminicoccaceae bacterium]